MSSNDAALCGEQLSSHAAAPWGKLTLLLGVAGIALSLAAPQALAGDYHPYVSLFGGAAMLTKNPVMQFTGNYELLINEPGYIIGGAVGFNWENQLRTELELSHAAWTSNTVHQSGGELKEAFDTPAANSVGATYLMANTWLDIASDSSVQPYFGGGLGIGWSNISGTARGHTPVQLSASGLAFQLGAGVRFDVSTHVQIDAGYRFKDIVGLNYNSINSFNLSDSSLASHNFQIGLTYQF